MKIIVAGGSGFIGRAFSSRAVQEGDQVWILTRNLDNQPARDGVTAVQWDGKTDKNWGHLVEEADVIVNLTGENLSKSLWTAKRKQQLLSSRVDPGKAITEAIQKARRRPKVLLQSSGIGYYGNSQDRVVDENSPAGADYMAQLCVQWEESTRPVEEMGVRRVVIRNSPVFAKNSIILFWYLLPFRIFVGGPIGSGKQWVTWIHFEDQIEAMLHLIRNENARGAFNLVAPEGLRNAEFGKVIARTLKRPYWFPTPGFALRLALGEMSNMVLEGQRANPDKLIQSGYDFKYPTLAGALKQILDQR